MISRVIQYTPAPGTPAVDVTVRISAPRRVGEDWSATLEISGLPEAHRTEHHGVDSLAALGADPAAADGKRQFSGGESRRRARRGRAPNRPGQSAPAGAP